VAVVGDGESETGPLATSWHINKFLNSMRDGAILPIQHLNGYKINNPGIWTRVPREEIEAFFRGNGWIPYFVEGSDAASKHQAMAATLDHCIADIQTAQKKACDAGKPFRPRWPMIVLRSPKGWTSPAEIGVHMLARRRPSAGLMHSFSWRG
jgi:xylulose-5-phosphate/fructose-6-phosphate phosphoketolase